MCSVPTAQPCCLACHTGRALREHLVLPCPGQERKLLCPDQRKMWPPTGTHQVRGQPGEKGQIRTRFQCHLGDQEAQHSYSWAGIPLLALGLGVVRRGFWTSASEVPTLPPHHNPILCATLSLDRELRTPFPFHRPRLTSAGEPEMRRTSAFSPSLQSTGWESSLQSLPPALMPGCRTDHVVPSKSNPSQGSRGSSPRSETALLGPGSAACARTNGTQASLLFQLSLPLLCQARVAPVILQCDPHPLPATEIPPELSRSPASSRSRVARPTSSSQPR